MPKLNNSTAARGKNRKSGNEPKLTAAQESTLLAKQLRIRPKTKDMVDMLLADPKLSQTEAYIRTHKTESRKNASIEASKLLSKPSVQVYKDSAVRKAKRRVVQLIDSASENISLKAAQDVLDRNEGKAIQRNESTSKVVEVRLDLTGVRIGTHYLHSATPIPLPE